jgi:UDP-galactopyranose mutase
MDIKLPIDMNALVMMYSANIFQKCIDKMSVNSFTEETYNQTKELNDRIVKVSTTFIKAGMC